MWFGSVEYTANSNENKTSSDATAIFGSAYTMVLANVDCFVILQLGGVPPTAWLGYWSEQKEVDHPVDGDWRSADVKVTRL